MSSMSRPTTLDEVSIGIEAKIVSLLTRKISHRQKLFGMGFIPGSILKVIRKAPLDNPIEISVNGSFYSLRAEEARLVLVEI